MEKTFVASKEGFSLEKSHTYGIKAKARFLKEIKTEEDLKIALQFGKSKALPTVFLGRGSNIIFRDNFFDGLVLLNKRNDFHIDGTKVYAQSGVNMPLLARKTARRGLRGLACLVGIPGTVGGCIFMNAGAGGLEVSDYLVKVDAMDRNGERHTLNKSDCMFAYRESIFHKRDLFILDAEFELQECAEAKNSLQEHLKDRLVKQPIEERNSGCIFRNPEGYSAGALIDQCGLKGKRVGGAVVSAKHANFINNEEDATFEDVMGLIEEIKDTVKESTGVELEYEVRIL